MKCTALILGFLAVLAYGCSDKPASESKAGDKNATQTTKPGKGDNLAPGNTSGGGTLTDGQPSGPCDQLTNPGGCPPGTGAGAGESDVMGVLMNALRKGVPNGKGFEGGKCQIADLTTANNIHGGPAALVFRIKKQHILDWEGDDGEVIILNPAANPSSVSVSYPAGLLHVESKLTKGQVQDAAEAFGLKGQFWDHQGLGQKIWPMKLHTKITVDSSTQTVLSIEHREEHDMWNLIFNDRIVCNGGK